MLMLTCFSWELRTLYSQINNYSIVEFCVCFYKGRHELVLRWFLPRHHNSAEPLVTFSVGIGSESDISKWRVDLYSSL